MADPVSHKRQKLAEPPKAEVAIFKVGIAILSPN